MTALERSTIPGRRYQERCAEALAAARKDGLDAVLVWGRGGETGEAAANVLFYANHFSAFCGQPLAEGLTAVEHAGVLIDGDGHSTLMVSGFLSEDAVADEVRRGMDLYAVLEATLRERGLADARIGVVGIEALPFSLGQHLTQHLPKLRLEAADELSARQRMVLGAGDLEMLRNAAQVGTRIVRAITDAAKPGVTEGEAVGAGLAEAARTPGCIHWAFMIASGPDEHLFVRSGTPAWNPGYVYEAGDVLHVDAYGFVFGYMYDLMRTVVVGAEPTDAQRRTIEASRDAIATVAGKLAEGVTPRELRAAGTGFAEEHGFDASGNATFGHGINAGWAQPYLQEPMDRPEVDEPLVPPYAFAFEAFLHDGDGNYAKWEDQYAWTADGVERLTGEEPGPILPAPLGI